VAVRIDLRRAVRTAGRYAASVALAAVGLSITHLLLPRLGDVAFLVSWVAVTMAAFLGGIGPGLLATGTSAAGYAFFFFAPLHSFRIASSFESFQLLLFVSVAAVVSAVVGALRHRSRRLLREQERAWVAESDARRFAERLALSQSITSDLAVAWTQEDVATVLVKRGLKAFDAKAVGVTVPISTEELDVILQVRYPARSVAPWLRIRIDSDDPRADAFRTGEAIWLESPEEFVRRYPHLREKMRGDGAWAVVPMMAHGRPLGVITFTFAAPRSFDLEERHFISFIASKYGQALERARLSEAERSARARAEAASQRAGLLASLGVKLNAGASLFDVLGAAANGARGVLGGDDAAIWLAEPDGHHLRGAFEIGTVGRVGALHDLDQLPHSREAVAHRCPIYFTAAEAGGEEPAWFQRLGIESAVAAPLLDEERFIGILFVDYRTDRFSRSPEDLEFVNAVAGLSALAVARAQVYEAEKKARLRAEAAEMETRRIGALQERLVAVVGHDLRNPLGAIIMGAERLKTRRRNMEPWERSVVALMMRSAERMQGMIADVLDFSVVRRGGGIPLRTEHVKLSEICRHVISELEQARPGRSVSLRVEKDDEGEWDPGRLARVVSNLVANALQHSPRDAAVEVRIRGSSHHLVLEVHDSGPPIPEAVLAAVFEPFTKGSSPSDDLSGNIGLGLYIVREIARAHQGKVDVCSRADKGTSFIVKLPRHPTLDPQAA